MNISVPLRLLKTFIIVLIFTPNLLAHDQYGQTIEFPVHLSLLSDTPGIYFNITTESSSVINTFQSFPTRNAKITRIGANQLRIHLETPITVPLSNRDGSISHGQRIIQSFVINYAETEDIETLMGLRKGDLAAVESFKTTYLTDVIERVEAGEVHELVQDLENERVRGAFLQTLDSLEFFVSIEEVGLRSGALVESIFLNVRDFANLHLIGPDLQMKKTNTLESIVRLFRMPNPLIDSYRKAVSQVVAHRETLWNNKWLYQPPQELPEDPRKVIQESENVHSIFDAISCKKIFKQ